MSSAVLNKPTNPVEASRLLASVCSIQRGAVLEAPDNSDPLEEHRPPLCAVYLRQLGTTSLLVLPTVPVASSSPRAYACVSTPP